ncbi:C40 family peptidase [Actinoplanes subtropicus]|uniref:C40 family peptidase n=1 Tax=Actinoplanes subtropicus TaxID=543632 RepID=UPI00068F94D9|nr:NlpC/P60 family protein [Actinoplanes subtropicus]
MAVAITGTLATAAQAAPSTSDLKKQIDAASNQLEGITESYNKLNIDLQKTTADEKALEASIGPARAKLLVAQRQVNTIASTAYMQGRIGPMSAMLGSEPGGLVERLSYLAAINRANQRDIDDYTTTTATFADRQAALKTAEAKQAAQLSALNARKATIEANLKKLMAMRVQAYGSANDTSSTADVGDPPAIAGKAGIAVDYAYAAAKRKAMYVYATAGPKTYDCSGLTMAAWAAAGKSLPHNAAAQYSATARVTRSELEAGDLVFYHNLGHVGLYVGGGQIIDASQPGEPVSKRSIDYSSPYGYGRVK